MCRRSFDMGEAYIVYKYCFCIWRNKASKPLLYGDALKELWRLRDEPHKWYISYYIQKAW